MLYKICFFWSLSLTSIAQAARPLIVDDLVMDMGKIKFDISAIYTNTNNNSVFAGDTTVIQTGPVSYISIPTTVSDRQDYSDSIVSMLGLRYGLTEKTEVYSRVTYLFNRQRANDASGTSGYTNSYLADLWIGFAHQFKEENETPGWLGFLEISARERHDYSTATFKSSVIGFTTYKALDPIVFSLTSAYRFNLNRKDGTLYYKPGNYFLINPSVGFAANDQVTLNTGLLLTNRRPDYRDNSTLGLQTTSTDLLFGVGYSVDQDNTLNFTVKVNASGKNGTDLRINWLHTI
ncbi:hypothetical protein [Microvirgula aerodenitrificans]|uniref:hypothetical protein n=1 Tax=Microvirgula aerodenitrificans TaxID=57480 RepID=UPI0028E7AB85|nr:hypothetical protein [Microvirgula aerodenitrificans]